MRSGNPVLNVATMDSFRGDFFPASQSMTIQGAATKALILLGLCIGTGSFTFGMTHGGNGGSHAVDDWRLDRGIGLLPGHQFQTTLGSGDAAPLLYAIFRRIGARCHLGHVRKNV